jgi:hypothetical protein
MACPDRTGSQIFANRPGRASVLPVPRPGWVTGPYHTAMPDRDRGEPASQARAAWRTRRPSRWRVKSDAQLRRLWPSDPDSDEPGVVDGILRERAGLLGILFGDGDDDRAG